MVTGHAAGALPVGTATRCVCAAWAAVALSLGAGAYLAGRPAGHALLLPATMSLATSAEAGWVPGALVVLAGWLPSFVHPFAFSLLSQASRVDARRPAWAACMAWWALNVVFEAGQHHDLAPVVAAALVASFGDEGVGATLFRPVAGYLLRGTFDPGDLAAATLGALAAAVLVSRRQAARSRDAA